MASDTLYGMELWAALVGGAISLAGVCVTLWWTNRGEQSRLDQEQLATIRSEKRRIYADMIRSLDFFHDAAVDIAVRKKDRDWGRYWSAREDCLKAGADLQLLGSYAMIDACSEALDFLMAIGWQFYEHPEANPHMQDVRSVTEYVSSRTEAALRESNKLRDLMRVDLGYEPLEPAIEKERQRARPSLAESPTKEATTMGRVLARLTGGVHRPTAPE